jgi:hypothetical protein
MSYPPSNAVIFVAVESNDKSGVIQYPDQWLQWAQVGGLVVRCASGVQIHGSGDLGHQRPGDYNDHSLKAHVSQAKRLGLFCFPEFDLHLGGDFHFAGDDFWTKDNQFVPFAYQLDSLVPQVDYHAIVLRIHDGGNTGVNLAQNLSHFLRMIDEWKQVRGVSVPVYLRLTKEVWERDSGQVASIIVNRYKGKLMPYALDGVTQIRPTLEWDNPPKPYEADVWEPGPAGHKWQCFCLWFFTEAAGVEFLVGWGDKERAGVVLGSSPGGVNPPPPPNGGGDDGLAEQLATLFEKVELLEANQSQMLGEVGAVKAQVEYNGTTTSEVYRIINIILKWTQKSWFARFKGSKK